MCVPVSYENIHILTQYLFTFSNITPFIRIYLTLKKYHYQQIFALYHLEDLIGYFIR